MPIDKETIRKTFSKDLTEILIRLGLIAFLVVMSIKIFSPFMGLMMWALILAVTLYPVHQRLAKKLKDKQGRAATLLVLVGVLIIGLPTVMLAASFADYVYDTHAAFKNNTVTISPPSAEVAEWPVVGPKIHEIWTMAANDLPELIKKMQPQIGSISKSVLNFVAGTAGGILQFLFALVIAGVMMAYGQSGSKAMENIICRLAGSDKGTDFYTLSTATIRSVSMGVIGVAFIQALILGVGFVWADVPGAGLLAIVVLILGIAQIPAALISFPVIAYVWWSGDSTMMNVVFTIYFIVGGMIDGVLKPLMLGRGVDAPMPIILLGALGGMVSGGMVGLFVGAVLLSLGYVIFMDWVAENDVPGDSESEDKQVSEQPA